MNLEKQNICKTLLYAKVFGYPISKKEIIERLGTKVTTNFEQNLEALVQDQSIIFRNDRYSISESTKDIEGDRQRASKFLKIAKIQSSFLRLLPTIQYLFISGSLSKGYVAQNGDIDYFVITKKNRVWTTKFFFAVFIRIYKLFRAEKLLCVNYIVDTDTMKIKTNNIFTATELVTLIPVSKNESYKLLLYKNRWVKDFFPNTKIVEFDDRKSKSTYVGNFIEKISQDIVLKRWQRKQEKFASRVKIKEELLFNKKVFKHHHNNYMYDILNQYEANCKAWESVFLTSIDI